MDVSFFSNDVKARLDQVIAYALDNPYVRTKLES